MWERATFRWVGVVDDDDDNVDAAMVDDGIKVDVRRAYARPHIAITLIHQRCGQWDLAGI